MPYKKLLGWIVCAALYSNVCLAADVTVSKFWYELKGEILPGDESKVRDAIAHQKATAKDKRLRKDIYLNSPGGDVHTAMKIGRMLRNEDWSARIPGDGACVSACVLILAGAVDRSMAAHPDGNSGVGIHRFYFGKLAPNLSRTEINKRYNETKQEIARYLDEMNVASSLLAHMESVPPGEVLYLTVDQAKMYRLSGRDPVYDEQLVAEHAAFYGISSAEYRRRDAIADARCHYAGEGNKKEKSKAVANFLDCLESVRWHLPISVYRQRKEAALREAGKHSVAPEQLRCLRQIMSGQLTSC